MQMEIVSGSTGKGPELANIRERRGEEAKAHVVSTKVGSNLGMGCRALLQYSRNQGKLP
jgi:hypothetical protein